MVCDLQFTHNNGMVFKGSTKCLEISGPLAEQWFGAGAAIIGGAGSSHEIGSVWNWILVGDGKPPRLKDSEYLALTDNKTIFYTCDLINWLSIKEPYYAIGSGAKYAIGALAAKSIPMDAVMIAGRYDMYTGIEYKEYTL